MLRAASVVSWLVGISVLGGAAFLLATHSAGAAAAPSGSDSGNAGDTAQNSPPPTAQPEESDDTILRTVPTTCVKEDGSVDHEALVAHQKKRVEALNRKFGFQFTVIETPHYLVVSDTDAAMMDLFGKWGEALYANLGTLFGVQDRERIWDAKCMLFVFRDRGKFNRFGLASGKQPRTNEEAYFSIERYGKAPQLVKICMPVGSKLFNELQRLLSHEGAHAFFELYHKPGGLPLWLHEGLAEYVTTLNERSLRAPKIADATRFCRSGAPLQPVFQAKMGGQFQWSEYCVSMTLVEFLMACGKPKFKKFVEDIKDGSDQEKALSTAYGFKLSELESRWRTYLTDYLPKHPKGP
jgi:hypothetical protein